MFRSIGHRQGGRLSGLDGELELSESGLLWKKNCLSVRGFIGYEQKKRLAKAPFTFNVFGHDITNADGNLTINKSKINTQSGEDHGCDPLGDGKFRMVPSGDIVDTAEMQRRLKPYRKI